MPEATLGGVEPELVIVHPLVLLSVVDHYQRSAVAPGKRIVGVLMGHWTGRTVHLTNSYACKTIPLLRLSHLVTMSVDSAV